MVIDVRHGRDGSTISEPLLVVSMELSKRDLMVNQTQKQTHTHKNVLVSLESWASEV